MIAECGTSNTIFAVKSGELIYGDTLMCLPLRARNQTLGVLTLEVDGPKRLFSSADIKTAESLASRLAMAMDNC